MSEPTAMRINEVAGGQIAKDTPASLEGFALDGLLPKVVAHPESPEQVGHILKEASKAGWGVIPWGGGHDMACGRPPGRYDIALSLSALAEVIDHDVENLTITVGAGLSLLGVQRQLAPHHQILPLGYAGSLRTMGGIIASNPVVPRRLLYGDVRDQLLGLRVALPDGTLVRYGRKVIKNVAGYDMMKFFLGTRGMLGVVVDATFKLFSQPDEEGWMLGEFPTLKDATNAAATLYASRLLPGGLFLLDGATVRKSGLHGEAKDACQYLLVAFEGRHVTLTRQLTDTVALLEQHQGREVSRGGTLDTNTISCLDWGRESKHGESLSVRVGLPPSEVGSWLEDAAGTGFSEATLFADYGAGLCRMSLPIETVAEHESALVDWLKQGMLSCGNMGGYLMLESGPTTLRTQIPPWGGMNSEDALTRRFRSHFDAQGIMVPNRFL